MLNKVIAFDLDDVLCFRTSDLNGIEKYQSCYPNKQMIDIVNDCYDNGAIIKIYTARGMTVFNGDVNKIYSNLYSLTFDQLNSWGVKFHELVMGKLHYDVLIDDKVVNYDRIQEIGDIEKWL
jgi:hypothetical protein